VMGGDPGGGGGKKPPRACEELRIPVS